MSAFRIQQRAKSQYTILELHGELDAHTSPQLEEMLQNLIKDDRIKIIVNCQNLDYIASAGLGVFMAYIEDLRQRGGDIKLSNMKPRVYNVFDLLGFPTLYDIFETEDQAIHQFSTPN